MKHDFSDRSHDQPRKPKGMVANGLIVLGGAHPRTLREGSSEREVLDFMIFGWLLVGSALLTASTVTTILHFAMGDGHFHLLYALFGIGIGALQGTIDNVLQYRRSHYERGYTELRRAGMRLPEVVQRRSAVTLLRAVRLLQGGAIGVLGGVCMILAAMGPSIDAYSTRKFLADNRTVAIEATRMVDAGVARTTDDFKAATVRVDQLNRMLTTLRQDNVRRAVRTGGRTAVSSTSASDAQIAILQRDLDAETSKRDGLKATLDRQLADSNAVIERNITTAPNAIPKLSGLSGQLEALAALTKDDPKLLFFVIAFQLISLALELGPMWVSVSYFPSTYAARMTMQHFIDVTKISEEGARQLGVKPTQQQNAPETDKSAGAAPANDNAQLDMFAGGPIASNDNVPVAASGLNGAKRRGAGRPLGSKNRSKPLNDGGVHE
jgi:hypothetical protein